MGYNKACFKCFSSDLVEKEFSDNFGILFIELRLGSAVTFELAVNVLFALMLCQLSFVAAYPPFSSRDEASGHLTCGRPSP
jgi:hypothetical protein